MTATIVQTDRPTFEQRLAAERLGRTAREGRLCRTAEEAVEWAAGVVENARHGGPSIYTLPVRQNARTVDRLTSDLFADVAVGFRTAEPDSQVHRSLIAAFAPVRQSEPDVYELVRYGQVTDREDGYMFVLNRPDRTTAYRVAAMILSAFAADRDDGYGSVAVVDPWTVVVTISR